MTKIELIMILTAFMSITWAGMVTSYALYTINKHKAKVAYYEQPQVQCEIARHVINNKWYADGEVEVFK